MVELGAGVGPAAVFAAVSGVGIGLPRPCVRSVRLKATVNWSY